MIIAPRRKKLIWNPAELKLLVDKTVEKIIETPFKQGRSFLHQIVSHLLEHDEEVRNNVRQKTIISYESLRDCGFIPAFYAAWKKRHAPTMNVTVAVGNECTARTMPLAKLLEIVRQRIGDEFGVRDTTSERMDALAQMPELTGIITRHLRKETIAIVVSPGRYGTQVKQLQRRVEDVLEIDLVTDSPNPKICASTTALFALAKDPVATIASIGHQLIKAVKHTEVRVVKADNWRSIQDQVIEHASKTRRALKMV